jgi:hypothetical protein
MIFKIGFIIVLLLTVKFLYKFRRTIINDTTRNQINILEVKNIEHIVNSIPIIPEHIDIEKHIPSHLFVDFIKSKGWSLKTTRKINKGEIISKAPISFFSNAYNTSVSSKIGEKHVYPDIHSGFSISNKNVFAYWDAFINHDNDSNATYSPFINIIDGKYYFSLSATKPINKDEEITINYYHLMSIYPRLLVSLLIN